MQEALSGSAERPRSSEIVGEVTNPVLEEATPASFRVFEARAKQSGQSLDEIKREAIAVQSIPSPAMNRLASAQVTSRRWVFFLSPR